MKEQYWGKDLETVGQGIENSLQIYSNKYQTPQQHNQNCFDTRGTTAGKFDSCQSSVNLGKICRMVIQNQKTLVG